MYKFDFSFDELCASIIEANDKNMNERFDKEIIKEINFKLKVILGDFVDIHINYLRAAFIGLEDYIFLPEYERNNSLISNIVTGLFYNTGLKPELYTQGIKNHDLLAYTYYGLHLTNYINGNKSLAIRYLLKVFVANARIARNDLAPSVYDEFFKPQFMDYCNTQMQFVPIDPRRNFRSTEIQPFNLMEKFEKNIIIHNEEFEKNIDEQCINKAKRALGDYDLW